MCGIQTRQGGSSGAYCQFLVVTRELNLMNSTEPLVYVIDMLFEHQPLAPRKSTTDRPYQLQILLGPDIS